ncbi:MAG: hypothetical protein WA364_21610 [Candidatus Nitrosopolaris sp.]
MKNGGRAPGNSKKDSNDVDGSNNETDDPIAKMVWGLQPDNKARYPPRFKVILDYFGPMTRHPQ